MAEIVYLEDRACHVEQPELDDTISDQFLVNEGLELLAAYRSIVDQRIRLSVKRFVEHVAFSSGMSR